MSQAVVTDKKYTREGAFEFVNDVRYSALQAKTPLDKDNRELSVDYIYNSNGNPAIINSFTNNSQVKFDVQISSNDSVIDWDKSGVIVGMQFNTSTSASDPTAGAAAYIQNYNGMFWNTFEIIQSAELKGTTNDSIQNYDSGNNIGDIALHRMLMEYGKDELESMSDVLFTPCLESALDTCVTANRGGGVTGLSATTQTRSGKWCTTLGNTVYKFLPLGLLFSAVDKNAFIKNLKRLIIQLYFKPNNTANKMYGDTTAEYMWLNVTNCFLHLVQSKCTGRQEISNTSDQLRNKTENLSYLNRTTTGLPYTSGIAVQLSALANLNFVSYGFKAIDFSATVADKTNGKYINPCQYMPRGSAGVDGNQFMNTSINYGSFSIPPQGLTWLEGSTSGGIQVYQMYRACCMKSANSKDIRPAMTFEDFNTCYFIFYFPIYDALFLKQTDDTKRLQINYTLARTTNSPNTKNMQIVLHSLGSAQIFSDGSVSVLSTTY